MKIETSADFAQIRDKGLKKLKPDKIKISVGYATCGIAAGGDAVFNRFAEMIRDENLDFYSQKLAASAFARKNRWSIFIFPVNRSSFYTEFKPTMWKTSLII